MFCLVLQMTFAQSAVIFPKIPFMSDHLTGSLPTSSKFDSLHSNASKYWEREYVLHQPPVQTARILTQSCVFMQSENMPRFLRKQTHILTCFHYLCCLLVNVCITGQLPSPPSKKILALRKTKKIFLQWILGNYIKSQMFTWQKASICFTLTAQYLCQVKMWPTL